MARIRTIKPGFFASEGLSSVSICAQLLAGGLLCCADDYGYFNANPKLVKASVFPLRDDVTPQAIADAMQELAKIEWLRFGSTPDGRRWGHVCKFTEHQKVHNPTASKIKEMPIVWEVSGKIPEDCGENPPGIRKGNKEEEEEKERDAAALPPMALAQKVAAECVLPRNPGMIQAIAGAIEFCVKRDGKTKNGAVEFLIAECTAETARGHPPNKFWFDDRKWLEPQGKTNGAEQFRNEGRGDESVDEAVQFYRSLADPNCKECHGKAFGRNGVRCACTAEKYKAVSSGQRLTPG